jgi:hypothetical protein
MLITAFWILAAAVLAGSTAAIPYLRSKATAVPIPLSAVHGTLALTGFACLLIGLSEPRQALAGGVGAFPVVAAVLLGIAVLAGAGTLAARVRRKRIAELLIGVHATLAIGGFVVLAAYVLAR